MARRTRAGCAGAVVVLAVAIVAVQAPSRRVRAHQRAMTERLRPLADSQAARRVRGAPFAATPVEAGVAAEAQGVRLAIDAATDSGWAATASRGETTVACRIWVGRPARSGREGAVRCE